nr:MAG TPA: hypothetical protein [Caudoviricetes sp.]
MLHRQAWHFFRTKLIQVYRLRYVRDEIHILSIHSKRLNTPACYGWFFYAYFLNEYALGNKTVKCCTRLSSKQRLINLFTFGIHQFTKPSLRFTL